MARSPGSSGENGPFSRIRPATADDLGEIAAIFAHYVENSIATFDTVPPDSGHWRRRLANITPAGLPFLVADHGGDVIGFAYAHPWRPKAGYAHTAEDVVYLHPAHTGQGYGTLLLGAVLDGCARAGVHQVVAVIADGRGDGKGSVSLHRRLGFTEVGVLRGVGFKHDRWLDTTLMQRAL